MSRKRDQRWRSNPVMPELGTTKRATPERPFLTMKNRNSSLHTINVHFESPEVKSKFQEAMDEIAAKMARRTNEAIMESLLGAGYTSEFTASAGVYTSATTQAPNEYLDARKSPDGVWRV